MFPVDASSFVIQMDLILRDATREYVKFSFGLWGALFTQILFELMGRGRESLIAAAEAYAAVHTDFAEQIASSPAPGEAVLPEEAMPLEQDAIVAEAAATVASEELTPTEPAVEEAKAVEVPVAEAGAAAVGPNETVEIVADPPEGKDNEPVTPEPAELSIVAGPSAPDVVEAVVEPVADVVTDIAAGEAEAKDVMPV